MFCNRLELRLLLLCFLSIDTILGLPLLRTFPACCWLTWKFYSGSGALNKFRVESSKLFWLVKCKSFFNLLDKYEIFGDNQNFLEALPILFLRWATTSLFIVILIEILVLRTQKKNSTQTVVVITCFFLCGEAGLNFKLSYLGAKMKHWAWKTVADTTWG